MPPAIRVSSLSKLYQVGARQQGYKTLRESIADAFWSPVNRIRQSLAPRATDTDGAAGRLGRGQEPGAGSQQSGIGKASPKPRTLNPEPSLPAATPQSAIRNPQSPPPRLSGENFWALKDVSFEVQPGEVVGIIGRNGAGKSTLLKILSRITEPTSGRIELRGRVGSLLEVGTGFHPELTGRENIYMNGSILGMSRREIARKFDEIVAFAEIDDFLDTPVKRYSSGMYVRLAFAVAAHLEPEILIVDEVLAVGDQAFQRKCLGQMRTLGKSGRTVLFVSHNTAALEALCQTGVVLEGGRVSEVGPALSVIRNYQQSIHDGTRSGNDCELSRSQHPVLRKVDILDESGDSTGYLPLAGLLRLQITLDPDAPLSALTLGIGIDNAIGQRVLSLHTPRSSNVLGEFANKRVVNCEIPNLPLAPGVYSARVVATSSGQQLDAVDHAVSFTVEDGDPFQEGRGFHRGVCVAQSNWSTN